MAMAALIKKSKSKKAFAKKHKKECTFDEEEFMDQVSKNTFTSPAALQEVLQKEVDDNKVRARRQSKKYHKPMGPTPEAIATNPFVVQYLKEQQEMLTTQRSKYFDLCKCEDGDDSSTIASPLNVPEECEEQIVTDSSSATLPKDENHELNLSIDSEGSAASQTPSLFGPISDSSESDNETQGTDRDQENKESGTVSTVPADETKTEASITIPMTEDQDSEMAEAVPATPVENLLVQNCQTERIMMQVGTPSEDKNNQESIATEVIASGDQNQYNQNQASSATEVETVKDQNQYKQASIATEAETVNDQNQYNQEPIAMEVVASVSGDQNQYNQASIATEVGAAKDQNQYNQEPIAMEVVASRDQNQYNPASIVTNDDDELFDDV